MRALLRSLALAASLAGAGCVSVSENVASLGEVSGDSVLVVGKIEIVPPIKPEEQTYKAGWDVFNTKRHFVGRAILFMSDRPEYEERTSHALNPPLETVYFLSLQKDRRYMVKGSVTMELVNRVVSRRQVLTDQTELLFPAPVEFDVRPGDKAIYVGTLRLHRDEFHEVTRAEVRDQFSEAAAEFRRRFPGATLPRKALLRAPKAR
jgi:hypothetical protein